MEIVNEAFDIFDKDGDGTISSNEIMSVFKCFDIKITRFEANKLIEKYDTDASGEVEYNEFVHMMSTNLLHKEIEPELYESFKVFEKFEGDGIDGF